MPAENPLREMHEKAGATLAVHFDCVLPERFTETTAEYLLTRESVALVDTGFRAFFHLSGPDRVRYLNAVLTNNIKDLAAGQGNVALLLNPQGHVLAEVQTFALPERLLAVTHAMVRERTFVTLDKYIIMDDVTVEDATDQTGSLAVEGPRVPAVVCDLCSMQLEEMGPRDHVEIRLGSIPCRLVRQSLGGEFGAEFFVDRAHLAPLWQLLLEAVRARGGGPIGFAALDILRLEAGIPWFGYDFDDRYIPHEAGLENSHLSYTKGCYTGQEIVERVRSRGHVNRRRVGLRFTGSGLPERGTTLLADGEEVGQVTSAAHSFRLGCAIGMGYLRREHNAVGNRLKWSGGTAEVMEFPLAAVKTTPGAPSS